MADRKDIERLFAYDRWANGETLGSLERMKTPPAQGIRLLGHVVAAQAGWLRRMGVPNDFAGRWAEETSLEALRKVWKEALPGLWTSFWKDARISDAERKVAYTARNGEKYQSTVADVLQHLVIHSSYHRGQIAKYVREKSGVPAVTDFIHATRTGAVT